MLQSYLKPITPIVLEPTGTKENLEKLNGYINSTNDNELTVDITRLNLLDASTICSLGSTMQYIKNPSSKINWIVNSKKVKEYTTPMSLGNTEFITKR